MENEEKKIDVKNIKTTNYRQEYVVLEYPIVGASNKVQEYDEIKAVYTSPYKNAVILCDCRVFTDDELMKMFSHYYSTPPITHFSNDNISTIFIILNPKTGSGIQINGNQINILRFDSVQHLLVILPFGTVTWKNIMEGKKS